MGLWEKLTTDWERGKIGFFNIFSAVYTVVEKIQQSVFYKMLNLFINHDETFNIII